jgi:hypothetical protein
LRQDARHERVNAANLGDHLQRLALNCKPMSAQVRVCISIVFYRLHGVLPSFGGRKVGAQSSWQHLRSRWSGERCIPLKTAHHGLSDQRPRSDK